jgi:GxxExxY protein
MAQKDFIFQVCDEVRECSFAHHKFLRHGHKEKIYENGLANRLRRRGIEVVQQPSLSVFDDDGTLLGDLDIDMLVVGELVIELKAVKTILNEHIAQLLGTFAPPARNTASSSISVPRSFRLKNTRSPKTSTLNLNFFCALLAPL